MESEQQLNAESSVMQTLCYFDIFNYPLSAEEIHRFMHVKTGLEELKIILVGLVSANAIHTREGFFSLKKDPRVFNSRIKANKLAATLLPKAYRVGRFLSAFPFVRFIGISGSLSKHYADEKTDFDFFIITAPNRLWIARTLMHLFKKLSFLVNKQHYFCMNYYVAADHLTLEDRNRYTSIELATLKPVVNTKLYQEFLSKNKWLEEFVPNFELNEKAPYRENKSWIKMLTELLINCLFPGAWNKLFMKLTDIRWRSKWKKYEYSEEDYELAFRTRPYVSKNHPKNFQKMVLQREQDLINKLTIVR